MAHAAAAPTTTPGRSTTSSRVTLLLAAAIAVLPAASAFALPRHPGGHHHQQQPRRRRQSCVDNGASVSSSSTLPFRTVVRAAAAAPSPSSSDDAAEPSAPPQQQKRQQGVGDGTPTTAASSTTMSPNDDNNSSSNNTTSFVTLIGSTTSMAVAGTFFAALAWRRDALLVSFFIGAIGNGVLSKLLKKLIGEKRPDGLGRSELVRLKPSDGGMPSSHAMSLGFIGVFTALCLASSSASSASLSPAATAAALALIPAYVAVSLYYRVAVTHLHTKEQVAVGLVLGSANGAIWKRLCCCDGGGCGNGNMGAVASWVSSNLLDSTGHLPVAMLCVPALLGLVVVGSFERRIGRWLKSHYGSKDEDGKSSKDQ